MSSILYTAGEIRSIAEQEDIMLIGPSYNSTMKFKRFMTEDGHLFAKQSMSNVKDDASYFLCNEFSELDKQYGKLFTH
jgi:hypothetical protein